MDIDLFLQPIRRASLAQRVADTIKRYILTADLPAGTTLPPERQLAESLVVSRTVLREALGILVGEGFITKEAGRGIFVQDFDRQSARDSLSRRAGMEPSDKEHLAEFRKTIEIGALGLAIRRMTPAHHARLQSLITQMESKLERGESIASQDAAFHQLLLDATGNPLISRYRDLLEELVRYSIEEEPRYLQEERDELAVRHMREIVLAARAGDIEAARNLMEQHLSPRGSRCVTSDAPGP